MNKAHLPPLSLPGLRSVAIIETLILLAAGICLFFLPDFGLPRWVWWITPYNTVFLGAVYLAALTPIGLLAIRGKRAPVRLVLIMQLTFTFLLLAASLLYLDRFDFQRKLVWFWFFVYISIPLISAYYLYQWYRQQSPHSVMSRTIPSWRSRFYLRFSAALFGLYGLGLLIAPALFSDFWPWNLDDFHARLYSAVFLTPAIGLFVLSRGAIPGELITLGVMQVALGLLPLLGVVMADRSIQKINWEISDSGLWIGLFIVLALFGLGLIRLGDSQKSQQVESAVRI